MHVHVCTVALYKHRIHMLHPWMAHPYYILPMSPSPMAHVLTRLNSIETYHMLQTVLQFRDATYVIMNIPNKC